VFAEVNHPELDAQPTPAVEAIPRLRANRYGAADNFCHSPESIGAEISARMATRPAMQTTRSGCHADPYLAQPSGGGVATKLIDKH